MLRKRASFKPNLKQVSSTPQTPISQPATTPTTPATTTPDANCVQVQSTNQTSSTTQDPGALGKELCIESATINTATAETLSTVPSSGQGDQSQNLSGVSKERIQEAITQLTGQKFEPIKLLSLRSSANKNVKLKDLLFLNPPMTKDQKRHKKSVFLAKKNELKKSQAGTTEASTTDEQQQQQSLENGGATQTSDEPSLVPKVKMGPEGQLILDESSTIINRKNAIKEQEAIVEDNEDIISKTNYDSFRRRPTSTSQTKWSSDDTKKFYQALTILGTDFSMMESLLFSGLRSRTELHKKFKREERMNKPKIDTALANRISLNSEELEDLREIFYK